MRKIDIIKNKIGVKSISLDGILLNSRYNPYMEAEIFARNNIELFKSKIVVLYGAAFEYHIEAMIKLMDKNSELYVFDIDDEVTKLADKLKLYDDIKKLS